MELFVSHFIRFLTDGRCQVPTTPDDEDPGIAVLEAYEDIILCSPQDITLRKKLSHPVGTAKRHRKRVPLSLWVRCSW